MKTVQMTLDEDLVRAIDQMARKLHTNRSAFARQALRESIARHEVSRKEQAHREGYEKKPATTDEFGGWESEQRWGDE